MQMDPSAVGGAGGGPPMPMGPANASPAGPPIMPPVPAPITGAKTRSKGKGMKHTPKLRKMPKAGGRTKKKATRTRKLS